MVLTVMPSVARQLAPLFHDCPAKRLAGPDTLSIIAFVLFFMQITLSAFKNSYLKSRYSWKSLHIGDVRS